MASTLLILLGESPPKEASTSDVFARIDPSFLGSVPPKPFSVLFDTELEFFGSLEDADVTLMFPLSKPGPVAEDLTDRTWPLILPIPLIEVFPADEGGSRGERTEVVRCRPEAWLVLVFPAEKETSFTVGDLAATVLFDARLLPDNDGVGRADTLAVLIVLVRGGTIPLVTAGLTTEVVRTLLPTAEVAEPALVPNARDEVLVRCLSVLEPPKPLLTGVADPTLLVLPERDREEVLARCLRVRVMPALLVTIEEPCLGVGGDRTSIAWDDVDDICIADRMR